MMKPLICLDDTSTYPNEIENLVWSYKTCLQTYLKGAKILADIDVRCAIEYFHVYRDNALLELQTEVLGILEQNFIVGFHNTRVFHKEDVLQSGLQLLETSSYFYRLRSILTNLKVDDVTQDGICLHLQEYLNDKHGNRTGMLSLFAPYSLNQDYWKFTKNIGGEVCEFGLSTCFPDVYNLLTSCGYPVTVKFVFPFSDVGTFRKDIIALEFIRHYAAKKISGYNYQIAFDAYLTKPVSPGNIIELIDFVDEYK